MINPKENSYIHTYENGLQVSTIYKPYDGQDADKLYYEFKDYYFRKPDFKIVKEKILKIFNNNGLDINEITRYYFFNIMCDCLTTNRRISINTFLNDKKRLYV